MRHSIALIFATIFFSLFSSTASAASNELLAAISQRLIVKETIKGDFEQRKFISILPQPLVSTGHFSFDSSQTLEWVVTSPIASRLVFGAQDSLNKDSISQAAAIIGQLLSAIFSMDWNTLSSYFVIDGSIEESHWQLTLLPKDAILQQVFTKVILSGNSSLQSLRLFEVGGDRTEFIFSMNEA